MFLRGGRTTAWETTPGPGSCFCCDGRHKITDGALLFPTLSGKYHLTQPFPLVHQREQQQELPATHCLGDATCAGLTQGWRTSAVAKAPSVPRGSSRGTGYDPLKRVTFLIINFFPPEVHRPSPKPS